MLFGLLLISQAAWSEHVLIQCRQYDFTTGQCEIKSIETVGTGTHDRIIMFHHPYSAVWHRSDQSIVISVSGDSGITEHHAALRLVWEQIMRIHDAI